MSIKLTEKQALVQLSKSWEYFDMKFIDSFLDNDVIYESQVVMQPIKGKWGVLRYYHDKFNAVSKSVRTDDMKISAFVGYLPSLNDRPCMVLTQTTENIDRAAVVLITVEDNRIKRIDLCIVPDPKDVIFFDILKSDSQLIREHFSDWNSEEMLYYFDWDCPSFPWEKVIQSTLIETIDFKYNYIPLKPCPLCYKSDPNTSKSNLFWVKYASGNLVHSGYLSICKLHKIQVDFLLENCLDDYNAINNAIEKLEYNEIFDWIIKSDHVFNGEYLQELFAMLNSQNIKHLTTHAVNCSELLYVYFTSEHELAKSGIVSVKEFGLWYGNHNGKYLINTWNLKESVEFVVSNLSDQNLDKYYPKMNLRVPDF
jgi:hypothetical protein